MADETVETIVETVDKTADAAHENRRQILEIKRIMGTVDFHLARLLKENRDLGFFKLLGYDSFNEFLAEPELAFRRAKAYNLIRQYELFVQKLGIDEDRLSKIGTRKLTMIMPVVEGEPEKWLGAAEALSRSDLTDEVRDAQGLEVMTRKYQNEEKIGTSFSPWLSGESYLKYVKSAPCCACGVDGPGDGVDAAHFPRTKGAGAEDWKVMPLCRCCHREQHDGGSQWLWENRVKVFDWFYGIVSKFFKGE